MRNSRKDILHGAALAWILFGVYAGFLSKAYVFEGLIRALPIETGRWGHLFPGNYLLYGPLGLVFHTVLTTLGFHHPAVISLQIMDSLIGAVGIFVFYLLLRRLGAPAVSSVIWTVVLGCSLGYWLWSTDAEDYILSTVLLLTNFFFLVKYRQEGGDPVILGALLGLSILGHIVNTVFGVVGLWFLYHTHGKAWRKPVLRYAAAMACVAGTAYAGVIVFIQKSASLEAAWQWFKGSAGAGRDAINLGGLPTPDKLMDWLKMSAHIFGSFAPSYDNPPGWAFSHGVLGVAWILLAVFAGLSIQRLKKLYRKNPAVVGGCLIWLAAYACVFTRWQPQTMVYRVSDLVPFCLLLFLGYQDVSAANPMWRGAAAVLATCLAIGNLGAEIYPRSWVSNNPSLERMAFLKANTVEGDWITGGSGQDEIYIPYFAQRRPIVIERYAQEPDRLKDGINGLLAAGQSVFVTSRVLETEAWKSFFNRYTLTLKAKGTDGFALYQVGKYHG